MWQLTPQGSTACLGAFGKMSGIECKHFLCLPHPLLLLLKFRIPSQFCFLRISFFCTPSQFCSPCWGLWKCLLCRLWFFKRHWILLRLLRDWLIYMHVHYIMINDSKISDHSFCRNRMMNWNFATIDHYNHCLSYSWVLSKFILFKFKKDVHYVNTDHSWSWFGKNLKTAPLD